MVKPEMSSRLNINIYRSPKEQNITLCALYRPKYRSLAQYNGMYQKMCYSALGNTVNVFYGINTI